MTTATAPAPASPYRDHKRYAWIVSLLVPATTALGPLQYMAWPHPLALWAPVIFYYCVAPLIDLALGPDTSNPPEEAVPALEADRYYRVITYLLVPLLWASFVFSAWFVMRTPLGWGGWIAMVMTTGAVGGYCINLGHELGHKRTGLEGWLAKIALAPTFYGHFTIEHNRGHHREVATFADSASARMGESIWRFMLREMPGAFTRAWQLERARMRADGLPFWSLRNELVQPALVTLALWSALCAWLGPQVLLFLVPASLWANFQLTTANYVEHYGLLRRTDADGRVERCAPHHSWNSNHVFSNWAMFHLQRHSDHHAHPARRYQSLRHFEELPQLPNGYFGMFPVAYLPPAWFWLMDRRLVAAVQGDASRINFDPTRRARLCAKFGLAEGPSTALPTESAA